MGDILFASVVVDFIFFFVNLFKLFENNNQRGYNTTYSNNMASFSDSEPLEDEIKEFIQNYKHKKATVYEPCTLKNIRECLIGLHEELELLNINYIFNPYIDLENNVLSSESLFKLINSVYALLHQYKNIAEKADRLNESNYNLENSNKTLNVTLANLKKKLDSEKSESRACVASAQRISEKSENIYGSLVETKSKLSQLTKQKSTKEKSLVNEITRLKMENESLRDKLRNKSGSFTPCADICDSTLTQLRDKEREQRAVITKLQENNRQLIQELLDIKEEIILSGLENTTIRKN